MNTANREGSFMDRPQTHEPVAGSQSSAAEQVEAVEQPLVLTAAEAAALFAKSLRTWRSWDAAGLIPRPIRIGRTTLWRPEELRAWVAAGCPCRKEWESRRE